MEYLASDTLPLRYDPLKALVAPRPIGWISTVASDGTLNLAPYSFFQLLSTRPGIVVYASGGKKDSVQHALDGGAFVCNIVTEDLLESMILTADVLPRGQSEFAHAGLCSEPSLSVSVPRVRGVAAALECRVIKVEPILDLDGRELDRIMVFGQVVGVYIDDRFLTEGRVDTAAMALAARCGYFDYTIVDRLITPERTGLKPQ